MDDGVRGRGHLLIARPSRASFVLVLLAAACGAPSARPRPATPVPALSLEPAPVPVSASASASAAAPPDPGPSSVPLDAAFRSALRLLTAEKPSLGHAGGRWHATTYANDAGERAWKSPRRDAVEPGALFVAEHAGDGEKGPVLVMQKRGKGYDDARGGWYYAVLAPDLRPLREGKLADCAGCHGLAKRDHVFGE